MASFYYNRSSKESSESQWISHLQTEAYINDIEDSFTKSSTKQIYGFSSIVTQQAKEINASIQTASKEQNEAIRQSTYAVCGTLQDGFDMLQDNLQELSFGISEISSEINEMASMLDWKLSLLIEQQKISNLLLGNIAILLRIPDIQKERQYYIEQGLKFLKNAFYDNDFYADSLTNLLKAEQIEPTDFFVLHRIGLIYLYSKNHLDLLKAEGYFKKAAKYAVVETNSSAGITVDFLNGDINKKLSNENPSLDSIKIQTAESYMFAARCLYIQGKFSEAIEQAGKAFKIAPKMLEAAFIQAKSLAADNETAAAVVILKSIIEKDRFYSLKINYDFDLCPKQDVQTLLANLKNEATYKASSVLEVCKQEMIESSAATTFIDKIERLIKKDNYLSSRKALDMLEKLQNWFFCEPFKNQNQITSFKEIVGIVSSFNNLQYCNSNGSFISIDINFADSFLKDINEDTQWVFPNFFGKTGFDITNSVTTKNGTFKTLEFIKAEKKFNDSLPFVISYCKEKLDILQKNNTHYIRILADREESLDIANQYSSMYSAVGRGIVGLIIGFIASVVINGVLSWFLKGSGMKDVFDVLGFVITVGCGAIGAYAAYKEKRVAKN